MKIVTPILDRRVGLGDSGELIVNKSDGLQEVFGLSRTVTVSSAQLLALNATPQTIIPAPGALLAVVPRRVEIYKAAGTAYAGIAAGEDLVLKYTGAGGAECSGQIETTGFLDQTTDQTRIAHTPSVAFAPVANAVVVLHLLVGEITTGNSALRVRVWYDLVNVSF